MRGTYAHTLSDRLAPYWGASRPGTLAGVATPPASTTRYARCQDLNIAYQVVGEGALDLVWVPNWISNVDMWRDEPALARFFDRLGSFARLIIFDRRGSGVSDPVVGAPTLEERMEDIRIVMDEVGSERAALFGFSEGAPMASLFAASHPDRVSALVLYGAYARTTTAEDYPWAPSDPGRDADRWDTVVREWGTGRNLEIFAPSVSGDTRFRDWWARFERAAASPASVLEILRLNEAIDAREVLPAISVPTLVLHRKQDRTVDIGNARYLAESIPGARLVEHEGVDHMPMVGDADALLDDAEEFLTGMRQERKPDRVLATVLFTDIVGSTERAGELGDRAWLDLLASHDALVRRELERHRGHEVKTVGDGFLATFDGPARAIRCAVEAVRAVGQIGVPMRAGLHTGEVEVIGDDVGGMAVHIGARVGATAEAGEVLVSGTVRDLVVGSGIGFADRGARTSCAACRGSGGSSRWRRSYAGRTTCSAGVRGQLDRDQRVLELGLARGGRRHRERALQLALAARVEEVAPDVDRQVEVVGRRDRHRLAARVGHEHERAELGPRLGATGRSAEHHLLARRRVLGRGLRCGGLGRGRLGRRRGHRLGHGGASGPGLAATVVVATGGHEQDRQDAEEDGRAAAHRRQTTASRSGAPTR